MNQQAPLDDPGHPSVTPPWLLLPLILPIHVVAGYISVALVFSWRAGGASGAALGGLLAVGMLPLLLGLVLAPLADAALGPRRWWVIGATVKALPLAALVTLPFGPSTLTAIGALIFLSHLGGTLMMLALSIVITATVAPDRKGRANMWLMIGKYAGLSLGGGGGLWLDHQGLPQSASVAIIVAIVVASGLSLAGIGTDTREARRASLVGGLRTTLAEVWSFLRTPSDARLLALCLLPVGLGTASDLWPVFSGHWHAGAGTLSLIQGGPAEFATIGGVVVGGWLADRGQPIRSYFTWSTVSAALVVVLALAPAVPTSLVAGALAYAFLFGLTQMVSLGVLFSLVGTHSGASKVMLGNVLTNVPVMIVLAADGWIGDRYGMPVVLLVEAALTVLSLGAFVLLFPGSLARQVSVSTRSRRLASA